MRCEGRPCLSEVAIVVCLIASALLSCSDSGGPCGGWFDRGLQIVPVDSIAFQDTLCNSDTLTIAFWSGTIEDRPEFSHFELDKDQARFEITAWAQVYEWVGGGSMPSVDQVALDGDTYCVPPPFYCGSVEIAVRQPDGTALVDTAVVKPCPMLVYSCSFESEVEIADWTIPGHHELTGDTPPGGGSNSICVSGIDIMPHAYYVTAPAEQDGYYILRCWARAGQPVTEPVCGGLVSLRLSEEQDIGLCVQAHEWTRYESSDTLFCPAGEDLLIGLTGDFHPTRPSNRLYVDLLEVWRFDR
jgi:hypothetical protein